MKEGCGAHVGGKRRSGIGMLSGCGGHGGRREMRHIGMVHICGPTHRKPSMGSGKKYSGARRERTSGSTKAMATNLHPIKLQKLGVLLLTSQTLLQFETFFSCFQKFFLKLDAH